MYEKNLEEMRQGGLETSNAVPIVTGVGEDDAVGNRMAMVEAGGHRGVNEARVGKTVRVFASPMLDGNRRLARDEARGPVVGAVLAREGGMLRPLVLPEEVVRMKGRR